jgi:4-hydroxy-3-polyprenylbenzoate decarboxylase
MFTKYLVVVSGDVEIRNYSQVMDHVFRNTTFKKDLLFMSGPLDVLDHTSDTPALGGKLGVDATIKLDEEMPETGSQYSSDGVKMIVEGMNQADDHQAVRKAKKELAEKKGRNDLRLILAVDKAVDVKDMYQVAWQILGNSDPQRDAELISENLLFIDGTAKAFREGGFSRKWPNDRMIPTFCRYFRESIDKKWESFGLGPLITSPSVKNSHLALPGNDEVNVNL